MLDPIKAKEQWERYTYSRDTGHRLFLDKANRCEDFFAGHQWDEGVVKEMRQARRPTLTINTVLNTLSSIFGEQIDTRSEISFRPRYSAPPQNAELMTKTFRFISDQNQLNWLRSEVFADGCITSRGFYDVRLKFDQNTAGEVFISRVNPRTVLPDPDGSDYDPETWNDVIVSSWVTADDISVLYNEADAKALALRGESVWSLGYDSLDAGSDRFGGTLLGSGETDRAVTRGIRLIDRQYRVLAKQKYFVDTRTGDKMLVPDAWSREDIGLALQKAPQLVVTDEVGKRIKWTVTAEDYVLHDDWSPFNHFTIVPYFPHFRYGRTIGVVEGLIDPQELLNKSLSQELHIVNTMANSGWKVRTGALMNLTMDELEEVGAKSGLIMEVNGDPDKDIVKITPNQIPQGLDRLSFKAENYVKLVSGRGNNQLGLTRPDQSGKLTEESNKSADMSLRKVLDNLDRTDHMLARNVVDIVQHFYTDPRIFHITQGDLSAKPEAVSINVPDPATGEVLNDLSLGTFDIVVVSVAAKQTLEESQFAQALALRVEAGIKIPDKFLIENSNLIKKADIVRAMEEEAQSPQAQQAARIQQLTAELSVANMRADTQRLESDSTLKQAKSAEVIAKTADIAKGDEGGEAELALKEREHNMDMEQKQQAHEQKLQHDREMHQHKMQQDALNAAEQRRNQRIQTMMAARQPKPAAAQAAA